MSFSNVAIIGLGLQGGSIGLAVQAYLPGATTLGQVIEQVRGAHSP